MDSRDNTDGDNFCCRICLEDGQRRDFIAPCSCTGSQKWVHRECLDKWRSIREDKAFSRCTECLKQYVLVCPNCDDGSLAAARRCRFFALVSRDFGLALCASQLVVISLALLVYICDAHSHVLIEALKQTKRPVLFYYSMGILLSLSILGMWFTVIQMGCCGDSRSREGGCCDCAGPGAGPVCGDGFYPCMYSSSHTTMVGAGDCCCAQAECCACCGHGAADGAGAATTGCGECAGGAAAGEECVALLLVAVVVFAAVGAVVCVVVGLAYAQKVLRAHWHVLEKYTLATDYVVADLAEGALPLLPAGGNSAVADVEAGGGGGSSGGTFGMALGLGTVGRGYRPLGSLDPAERYGGAGAASGSSGAIGMVELRNRGAPAGAPAGVVGAAEGAGAGAVSPLFFHRSMDREGAAATGGTADGEGGEGGEREGYYAGASAPYPYDPHLHRHRLSAAQYQDLARRGLV